MKSIRVESANAPAHTASIRSLRLQFHCVGSSIPFFKLKILCFLPEDPPIGVEKLPNELVPVPHRAMDTPTVGTAPESAKAPVAALMTPQSYRSLSAAAATGPKSVAAAIEQLKRAKAWA